MFGRLAPRSAGYRHYLKFWAAVTSTDAQYAEPWNPVLPRSRACRYRGPAYEVRGVWRARIRSCPEYAISIWYATRSPRFQPTQQSLRAAIPRTQVLSREGRDHEGTEARLGSNRDLWPATHELPPSHGGSFSSFGSRRPYRHLGSPRPTEVESKLPSSVYREILERQNALQDVSMA